MLARAQLVVLFLLAVIAAASMWFYVDRVLVGYQVRDAAAHDRPRGNLSDLYPRWLGARELLLHHRNPYGEDITREIQKGYYGRELDPERPDDPKDQQGFAYPVYVVFLLAPLIGLPFHAVRIFFHWLLVGLTAGSVCWWLRGVRWRLPGLSVTIGIALTLGSFPTVQGIKLQQLSLLVAALLAGVAASLAGGLLSLAGILLALATIKPQLAWPLVAWLLVWAIGDWRTRRRLVLAFVLSMALLLGGAQIVLPGWVGMFVHAIEQYHRYTQNQSVLDELVPWGYSGKILATCVVLTCGLILWRLRAESIDTAGFGRAIALVMALTVLVVPMYAPYNQILLLPAILALLRDRWLFTSRSRAVRFGYLATAFGLAWQWIASLVLSALFLLGEQELAFKGWWWPGAATFALPVMVFALMLIDTQATHLRASAVPHHRAAGQKQ